jgi:hypothetical protein
MLFKSVILYLLLSSGLFVIYRFAIMSGHFEGGKFLNLYGVLCVWINGLVVMVINSLAFVSRLFKNEPFFYLSLVMNIFTPLMVYVALSFGMDIEQLLTLVVVSSVAFLLCAVRIYRVVVQ